MGICKFCNEEKELVKSHIIPRAFFESIKGPGNKRALALKKITNTKEEYPFGSTIKGLYDPELLCAECENLFKPLDDYAIQLLLKTEKAHVPYMPDGQIICWRIAQFDYKKLMLFFIFLAWRAGITTLKEFHRISLGPYLEIAKNALVSGKIKDIEKFSVILARFPDQIGRSFIADPYLESKKEPFPQLNVYHFHLGAGYVAYIKADKHPFGDGFERLKISNNQPLIILCRNTSNSKDVLVLQKVFSDAEQIAKKWNQ